MKKLLTFKVLLILYVMSTLMYLIDKDYETALLRFLISYFCFQIIIERIEYNNLLKSISNKKEKSSEDYLKEIKDVNNQSFQKPIVTIDSQNTNVISFRLKNETNKKIENITFLDLTKLYFTNNYKSKEVQIEVIQSDSKGHFLQFLKNIQEKKSSYPIKKILVISDNYLNTWVNYVVYSKESDKFKNNANILIDSILKKDAGICEIIPHKEVILDNASKLDLLFILPNSEIDIYIEY